MYFEIINIEAENEHFEICDSVISWMEANRIDEDKRSESSEANNQNSVLLRNILPPPSTHHQLSAPGMGWNLIKIFSKKQGVAEDSIPSVSPSEESSDSHQIQQSHYKQSPKSPLSSPETLSSNLKIFDQVAEAQEQEPNQNVRMRGNDEWAPPRAQIIFNIHEETNFRKLMQRQNYRCAGCGTTIDLELARRLVLYCHYLGKYFCKCCFSHKAIHLPGYILQKWDFHKYPVSYFALQLLDRIANEPLFNVNDINSSLYRKVKKLRHLVDIRMQLYYLKIYISSCTNTDKLSGEYASFTHQHLLQDDVHLYSLNNLIEVQHGKLYEYLNDLVTRSIAHIAQCDRCRAKGHYCQLCGPSGLISSMILSSGGQNGNDQAKDGQQGKLKHSSSMGQSMSSTGSNQSASKISESISRQPQVSHSRSSSGNYSNFTLTSNPNSVLNMNALGSTPISSTVNDHELIFPFEIGRVAQCSVCGCCFHLQCFRDADQNCPKCERIQRRRTEMLHNGASASVDNPPNSIKAS